MLSKMTDLNYGIAVILYFTVGILALFGSISLFTIIYWITR